MEGYSFIAAFGAVLASFLSPCVLPLVPVFLASLAGPGFLTDANYDRKRLFFYALSFVAGFGILFTLAGALVGLAGIYIGTSSLVVRIT
jgi:cytochrome c-type biogenesis protein